MIRRLTILLLIVGYEEPTKLNKEIKMSNDSKLVTIYKPKDRSEYYVISGLLDSAGIE